MNKVMHLIKQNSFWLAHLVVFGIIVLVFSCIIASDNSRNRNYDEAVIDWNSGWTDDEGNTYNLQDLPEGELRLHRDLTNINLENKRFCMKTVDTLFDVYVDGKQFYHYYPEHPDVFGVSYGMYIHAIPIPIGTQMLTIEVKPTFADGTAFLTEVLLSDAAMYMADVFQHGLIGFCICVLMIVMGIATMFLSVQVKNSGAFITLGMFSVLAAVWSVNDTMIMQVLTQNPGLIRVLSYLALCLLPYPSIAFITKVTNHKSILAPLIYGAVAINFLSNILLTWLHISDYRQLVFLSQCMIVVTIITSVYLAFDALWKQKEQRKKLFFIVTGVCLITVGSGIDLIRFITYGVRNIEQTSVYTRIGILACICVFISYLIKEFNRASIEGSRMELMDKLAHTDALTGMKNLLSFNEMEICLKTQKSKCVIIQLDINDLKMVNDTYGHAEGDKHICAAGQVITSGFSSHGISFRTGGDEFTVVMKDCNDVQLVNECIQKMLRYQEKYNTEDTPLIPLYIAYGYSLCTDASIELEQCEVEADRLMYRRKRKMKRQMKKEAST